MPGEGAACDEVGRIAFSAVAADGRAECAARRPGVERRAGDLRQVGDGAQVDQSTVHCRPSQVGHIGHNLTRTIAQMPVQVKGPKSRAFRHNSFGCGFCGVSTLVLDRWSKRSHTQGQTGRVALG